LNVGTHIDASQDVFRCSTGRGAVIFRVDDRLVQARRT
jgi:hypothetical protein